MLCTFEVSRGIDSYLAHYYKIKYSTSFITGRTCSCVNCKVGYEGLIY